MVSSDSIISIAGFNSCPFYIEALRLANLIKKDSKFKNNKILDLRITNHIITSNE